MVSIGKIGTAMKENLLYKPVKWMGDLNAMKKMNKNYQQGNDNVISAVGVTSIVLRDGLGCYLYVTQSLNNEKIPEDKRKFVAALDLVNGVLMMGLQIGMFFCFNKAQDKLFSKTLGKNFNRSAAKGYHAALAKTEKFKGISGDDFHPALDQYKGTIVSAFKQVSSLAATTIIAKRMIVPFISTPLAGKAKDWMSRNDKPVQVNPETENSFDTEKKLDVTTADAKVEVKKADETKAQKLDVVSTEKSENTAKDETQNGNNLINKYLKK